MGSKQCTIESTKMEAISIKRSSSSTTRVPFSDRTNTIDTVEPSQSSSSSTKNSSSIIKPSDLITSGTVKTSIAAKPSKTLVDPATRSSTTASGKGDDKVAQYSADLVPLLSTPSRTLKPSFPEVTVREEAFEPSSVRRQSADKRKRKEKEMAVPKSCFPAMKTRSRREKGNEDRASSLSKSCAAPNRKKQRLATPEEEVAVHSLPRDFIEQQRAYFAEIDAFQLSEEEVDELSD